MYSEEAYRAAYQRFRSKLRRARKSAHLTQREASRRLGKPQSFISKIESGERRVDFVELTILARLYGATLEFFRDDGQGNSQEHAKGSE